MAAPRTPRPTAAKRGCDLRRAGARIAASQSKAANPPYRRQRDWQRLVQEATHEHERDRDSLTSEVRELQCSLDAERADRAKLDERVDLLLKHGGQLPLTAHEAQQLQVETRWARDAETHALAAEAAQRAACELSEISLGQLRVASQTECVVAAERAQELEGELAAAQASLAAERHSALDAEAVASGLYQRLRVDLVLSEAELSESRRSADKAKASADDDCRILQRSLEESACRLNALESAAALDYASLEAESCAVRKSEAEVMAKELRASATAEEAEALAISLRMQLEDAERRADAYRAALLQEENAAASLAQSRDKQLSKQAAFTRDAAAMARDARQASAIRKAHARQIERQAGAAA